MKAEDCIFFQLSKINQKATRFWSKKINDFNITASQSIVINFLSEEDEITLKDLGKKTGLDSATLTGIIDRLNDGGFIKREQKPDDRRSILIHITEKGKLISDKIRKTMVYSNWEFLSALNDEEEKTFRALIKKVRS